MKQLLAVMSKDNHSENEIFRHSQLTDELWVLLIEKAIQCLRYHDPREPFRCSEGEERPPKVYGIDELYSYYKKYKDFESSLYGSGQYYRDHVVHVFRTWCSGLARMVDNDGAYLKALSIHGDFEVDLIKLTNCEKLSIWTIISLTHDLGYPLEKARSIVDRTRTMLTTFVQNPQITMDLSFHGAQNEINNNIVRLMSSKMERKQDDNNSTINENRELSYEEISKNAKSDKYTVSLQNKYYTKFQKSLENTKHGIVSTLVVYRLLTYFLESDYNPCEDYVFDYDAMRQFYIRREILRAIASHTCADIYHLYMGTFAFLLIIADDTQEWGRKFLSELYVPSKTKYELDEIGFSLSNENNKSCIVKESIEISSNNTIDDVINLLVRLRAQAMHYVAIFRDGQDTQNRDFDFTREFSVEYTLPSKVSIKIILSIKKMEASTLTGDITYTTKDDINKAFGTDFHNKLKHRMKADVIIKTFDEHKEEVKFDDGKAKDWRKGKIIFPLTNNTRD